MPAAQPTVVLQGIETPNVSVDPDSFFQYTRRLRFPMRARQAIAGFGSTDSVGLRQTGVVSKLFVRVRGTVTATAAAATTSLWPYGLVRAFRVSANGQSNLVNINGVQAKMINVMGNPALTSKGLLRAGNQAVGVATQQAGTLGLANEDWGTATANNQMGPAVTALTATSYAVDIVFEIPIAFDDKTLVGAIYAQTNATQLTLDIDWETHANLAAAGTLTPNLTYEVHGEVFSIPNVSGRYVVPDLSAFHSLIGFRQSGLAAGDNEVLLPGTGVGRQLMRLYGQIFTGTAPGGPLQLNDTNFGAIQWRYGGNDTPETVPAGVLRSINELDYNDDIGRLWGFFAYDWATAWAFRDSIDQGSTTDLRLVLNLVNTPTNGVAQIVQETLFAAPVGA